MAREKLQVISIGDGRWALRLKGNPFVFFVSRSKQEALRLARQYAAVGKLEYEVLG